jgi:hypothetical protein
MMAEDFWPEQVETAQLANEASPQLGVNNRAYFASWKIIPSANRRPFRTRLIPCRTFTR